MADDQRFTGALGGRRRGLAAVVCAGLATAACSSQPSVMTADPNVYPSSYRSEIIAYLRTYLNDPTGIREAAIGEPALRQLPGVQRYAVCLRFNAKDSTGKYQGSRDRLVVFLSGRLDTMTPARGEQCAGAVWQPFPELEKLQR